MANKNRKRSFIGHERLLLTVTFETVDGQSNDHGNGQERLVKNGNGNVQKTKDQLYLTASPLLLLLLLLLLPLPST